MQEVSVGDLVQFITKGTMPVKTGQVIQINGDMACIFVMDEEKIYSVAINRLKKI